MANKPSNGNETFGNFGSTSVNLPTFSCGDCIRRDLNQARIEFAEQEGISEEELEKLDERDPKVIQYAADACLQQTLEGPCKYKEIRTATTTKAQSQPAPRTSRGTDEFSDIITGSRGMPHKRYTRASSKR